MLLLANKCLRWAYMKLCCSFRAATHCFTFAGIATNKAFNTVSLKKNWKEIIEIDFLSGCFDVNLLRNRLPLTYRGTRIPYNGIFSRRQLVVVLSKKTWGLFFADVNFRGRQRQRKIISIFSAKIVERVAQLDFPSIEQLCGKKIFRPKVRNKTMKCLFCLIVTLCHTTLFVIKQHVVYF